MTRLERDVHLFIISVLFSLLNYGIIYFLIVELPLWKYFIIELLLLVSMKFYIFTTRKMKLR